MEVKNIEKDIINNIDLSWTGFAINTFLTEQIIKHYNKSIPINEITAENMKSNNETEVDFDFSSVRDVEIISIIKGAMNFNKELVVGVLLIPDLNVNLPIFKGLSDANLISGAAAMKADQVMGKGNYTLAGHNMKNKDLLFGSLMDIDIGSTVIISDGYTIYEYPIEN